MHDQLTQLRAALAQTQNELIEAEAELADRLAEINAFELEFEARVGYLWDDLERLEREIARANRGHQTVGSRLQDGEECVGVPVDSERVIRRGHLQQRLRAFACV